MEKTLLSLEQKQCIVFEGDSLTSRGATWPNLRLMNWARTWADSFSELLFCWKPELQLSFHNEAVGGSCCRDLLKRFDKSITAHRPDWVIVTIGNNDPNLNISIDEFSMTMTDYIIRAKKECSSNIVFLGGFKEAPHSTDEDRAFFKASRNYHEVLSKLAAMHGCFYIDVGSALSEKAYELARQWPGHTIFSDGVHLNEVGSIIAAGEVLKAFGIVK